MRYASAVRPFEGRRSTPQDFQERPQWQSPSARPARADVTDAVPPRRDSPSPRTQPARSARRRSDRTTRAATAARTAAARSSPFSSASASVTELGRNACRPGLAPLAEAGPVVVFERPQPGGTTYPGHRPWHISPRRPPLHRCRSTGSRFDEMPAERLPAAGETAVCASLQLNWQSFRRDAGRTTASGGGRCSHGTGPVVVFAHGTSRRAGAIPR
jgi:hypothetical protein